jgi:aryl-alcohol dehydrogenase-like predicted oxidoreductase
VRLVQEAVDAGVTFFDNAWEYNDHRSEEWMGLGLQGRRDKVFLLTKVCTHGRDKKVAMPQLEESLKRLRTDYLDLWQIHEVIYENDPDLHFAKGGVIEALDEAKQQGKVRRVTPHLSPPPPGGEDLLCPIGLHAHANRYRDCVAIHCGGK